VNVLDWLLIIVGALSLVRGLWRGAVSQIFGLLGFAGGFFLAYRNGEALGARLAAHFPSFPQPVLFSYALVFILSWFLIALAGAWISRSLHSGGLGGPDRLIGGALGLLKGALAIILLVWGLSFLVPPNHGLWKQSRLVPYVQQATRLLVEAAPKSFREKLEDRTKKNPIVPPGKNGQPPGLEKEKNDGAGKNQSGKRAL
jgi:membrane protein required for colicin V production